MIRAILACLATASLLGGSARGQEQAPVFRARADAVAVDISVFSGGRPFLGLSASDFELRDSGVVQTLESAEPFSGPLDVTLLIEDSPETETTVSRLGLSSDSGRAVAERIVTAVEEIRAVLAPADHLGMYAFDHEVRSVSEGRPELIRRGGAVLFDAITMAAMKPVAHDRRHLVVALTQGLDHHSLIPRSTFVIVLGKSSVVVHIIAIGSAPRSFAAAGQYDPESKAIINSPVGSYDWMLRSVTDLTGGRFFDLTPSDGFTGALRRAINEHRARYWLRYQPSGVSHSGWHPLSVKIRRPGRFDTRVRSGYWRQ